MRKNALYKYGGIPKAQKGIDLGIDTPGIGNEDRSVIEMVALDDINLILYQYQNPTLGLPEEELDKILVDYLSNYGEYLVNDDVKLSDYIDGLPISNDRLTKMKSSLPTEVQKANLNASTDEVIEEYYSLDRINDNVYKVQNLPGDKMRITNMATGKVDFSGDLDAYNDQSNVRLGDVIKGGKEEADAIVQRSNLDVPPIDPRSIAEPGFYDETPVRNTLYEPAPEATFDPNKRWLDRTAYFESNYGSKEGLGLSGYSPEETYNKFYNEPDRKYLDRGNSRYEQLKSFIPNYDQLPETLRGQIGDYFFNTGRDPRIMLLHSDGLISDEERTALHNGTKEMNKALDSGEIDQAEFDRMLKENRENAWKNFGNEVTYDRENIYDAVDEIYQGTKEPGQVGNPKYDNSWKARAEMWDTWIPDLGGRGKLGYDGYTYDPDLDSKDRYEAFENDFDGYMPVRNALLEQGRLRSDLPEITANDIESNDEDNVVDEQDVVTPENEVKTQNIFEETDPVTQQELVKGQFALPSQLPNFSNQSRSHQKLFQGPTQMVLTQQQPGQQIINTGRNVLGNVDQGVRNLVGKGKNKIQKAKADRQAKRDEYNQTYEEELAGIETAKGLIDDSRQFNKELSESNRLEGKGRRLTTKGNRLSNKYERRQDLNPIRQENRKAETQRKMKIQDLKSELKMRKQLEKEAKKAAKREARQEKKINKLKGKLDKYGSPVIIREDNKQSDLFQMGGKLLTDDDFDYFEDISEDQFRMLNGGKLPKAQNSLDLDEPYAVSVALPGDNTLFTNNQEITPTATTFNFQNTPYWLDNPDFDINRKPDTSGNDTQEGLKKTESPYGDYDPTKLYEYSNILQDRAKLPGIAYNTMMGLKPIKDPKMFYTKKNLRKQSITPNYLAIDSAISDISDQVRESSRSPQAMIANLVNARMQGAKQKSEMANKIAQQNLQLEQQYLDRVNQEKDKLDTLRDRRERQREANLVTRQQFQKEAINHIQQKLRDQGLLLGQEKSDRLRLNNYLNQLTADYEYRVDKNGMPYIVHKGTGAAMTMEQYKEELGNKAVQNMKTAHSNVNDPNSKKKIQKSKK
jgi:hypothetical protein